MQHTSIEWVIIGSQTKPYKPPKIEWVEEIVRACDKAGVKVFLKDNLKPLAEENKQLFYTRRLPSNDGIELLPTLRQELPR